MKTGYIDRSGKLVVPARYKWGWPFSEGIAVVGEMDGTWGYIDLHGAFIWKSKRPYWRDERQLQ